MAFSTASDLWRLRQEVTIDLHELSHLQFFDFSRSCHLLLSKIEVAYPDDYFWRKYGRALRRIRFDLAANPVPFDTASAGVSEVVRHYRNELERRTKAYPDVAGDATALVNAAELLVTSKDAPLLEYLYFNQLLESNGEKRVGLVVRESRYLPSLRDELVALDMDAVATLIPTRLKATESFERLIFIGPTAWFPDHVVASPRAPNLGFVHFDWLGPDRPPRSLHPGPGQGTWEAQGFLKSHSSSTTEVGRSSRPILEVVPSIDWNLILGQLSEAPVQDDGDIVPARLCALEGGMSVFLRGHDGARTYVLSFDQKQADLSWVPVEALEPGDFLLIRTTGGGDYVVELAWSYLGKEAEEVRMAQAHWKRILADAIRLRGAQRVARESTAKGAKAANAGNVCAWASEERIQPERRGDFIALLSALGLGDRADKYWGYGRGIFRARVKAGHYIRRLLIEQVRACDIEQLEERGRADFQLPGHHGGTITAWRLNGLAPFVVEVPAHRIGAPFHAPGL